MLAKEEPPLTYEERARRIRDLAAEAETSDDPEAFDRAFEKVVRAQPERAKKADGERVKS